MSGKRALGPMRKRHLRRQAGITDPAIRRLARRGGVKRASKLVYDVTREAMREFMKDIIKDALCYTQYRKQKTVSADDVVKAFKNCGRHLYGYGT